MHVIDVLFHQYPMYVGATSEVHVQKRLNRYLSRTVRTDDTEWSYCYLPAVKFFNSLIGGYPY
jgi:hypothetical protein